VSKNACSSGYVLHCRPAACDDDAHIMTNLMSDGMNRTSVDTDSVPREGLRADESARHKGGRHKDDRQPMSMSAGFNHHGRG